MYTYLEHPNTTLIAGVNLALVIGLTILEGDISREMLESVIEQSKRCDSDRKSGRKRNNTRRRPVLRICR